MFGISVTSPLSISWAAVERDLVSTWGELKDFQLFPIPLTPIASLAFSMMDGGSLSPLS